jgi:hypothetical protein
MCAPSWCGMPCARPRGATSREDLPNMALPCSMRHMLTPLSPQVWLLATTTTKTDIMYSCRLVKTYRCSPRTSSLSMIRMLAMAAACLAASQEWEVCTVCVCVCIVCCALAQFCCLQTLTHTHTHAHAHARMHTQECRPVCPTSHRC